MGGAKKLDLDFDISYAGYHKQNKGIDDMSWVENNLVNPVNKWFKHITSVIAGRTYRGKKKTLKRYIQKVIQSVDSAKNDMVNRMAAQQKRSDAAISGLQQQIAELKSVVANQNNTMIQQMTVQQNSSDAKISGVQQQITELKSVITKHSTDISEAKTEAAGSRKAIDAANVSVSEAKENIQQIKQNIEKVSAQINDTKQSVERNNVLYFNQFETITREERGLCDMVTAPNFEERFKKLIAGLPADSATTVVRIIRRLQMIKGTNTKLDLFTVEEKEQLKRARDIYKEILKVSDNLYAYKNYMLPINHFEPSVFVYNHGIDQLDSIDQFKDKDILDVGGFIGDSVLMLSPLTNGKIHSFEATSENFEIMLKTVELNGIKNAVPVHAAVGDHNGEIELRYNGSASSQDDSMVKEPKYIEKCKLIKIDDYVREHNINVGLIKVDIEGAEQSFLRGAKETICAQKPTLLISIYHNINDFLDIKPMIESWNLGYKFKVFKPTLDSVSGETLLICEQ